MAFRRRGAVREFLWKDDSNSLVAAGVEGVRQSRHVDFGMRNGERRGSNMSESWFGVEGRRARRMVRRRGIVAIAAVLCAPRADIGA